MGDGEWHWKGTLDARAGLETLNLPGLLTFACLVPQNLRPTKDAHPGRCVRRTRLEASVTIVQAPYSDLAGSLHCASWGWKQQTLTQGQIFPPSNFHPFFWKEPVLKFLPYVTLSIRLGHPGPGRRQVSLRSHSCRQLTEQPGERSPGISQEACMSSQMGICRWRISPQEMKEVQQGRAMMAPGV